MKKRYGKSVRLASQNRPTESGVSTASCPVLGCDKYGESMEELIKKVRALEVERQRVLLKWCIANLRSGTESDRVSAVKALVALLPMSWEVISKALGRASDALAYEIQFTVFCFLDAGRELMRRKGGSAKLLTIAERYLVNVRSRQALAAWMAGDMLGDHWPVVQSLPVLVRIATRGKFPAGREGALHGLSHAVTRVTKQGIQYRQIMRVIRGVAESDDSRAVREYARYLLRMSAPPK